MRDPTDYLVFVWVCVRGIIRNNIVTRKKQIQFLTLSFSLKGEAKLLNCLKEEILKERFRIPVLGRLGMWRYINMTVDQDEELQSCYILRSMILQNSQPKEFHHKYFQYTA